MIMRFILQMAAQASFWLAMFWLAMGAAVLGIALQLKTRTINDKEEVYRFKKIGLIFWIAAVALLMISWVCRLKLV